MRTPRRLPLLGVHAGGAFTTICPPPWIRCCAARNGSSTSGFSRCAAITWWSPWPAHLVRAGRKEKGQIEKQVQDIRNWLFIPRPRFSDLEELNAWLADRCQALSDTRPHPTVEGKTIEEVFLEEKEALIRVGPCFAGQIENECRVSSTSLVHYDRNHYSFDSRFAGKTATIRISADRIRVIGNGELIADHLRQFGRDKTVYAHGIIWKPCAASRAP